MSRAISPKVRADVDPTVFFLMGVLLIGMWVGSAVYYAATGIRHGTGLAGPYTWLFFLPMTALMLWTTQNRRLKLAFAVLFAGIAFRVITRWLSIPSLGWWIGESAIAVAGL